MLKKRFKFIPNLLTLGRIVIIWPFLGCFFDENYTTAFYIFVIAGCTDGLDGWLARSFHWKSAFGAWLDPLADKLIVVSSFVALASVGQLPWWLVILVFMRDLSISLGVIAWCYFVHRHIAFEPTRLSKMNTTLQLSLVTVCLFELAFSHFFRILIQVLLILTALTTFMTYINYVFTWSKKAYSMLTQ